MKKNESKPKTINELKKEKSKTNWGRVLSENEHTNKTVGPTQKARD